MRAWNWTAVVVLGAAWACGGSTSDDSVLNDSGGNDSTTADVVTQPDSGIIDTGTVIDEGPPDGTTIVDAGAFTPTSLGSSLVLWLDGAKGVTEQNNAVSAWADQTSNHNDATGGAGNQAHQPTVMATGLNSLPVMEFANTNFNQNQYFEIADSASLAFGTGDFAVFMVAEYTNAVTGNGAGQATFYNKVAGNQVAQGPQLYGNAAGSSQQVPYVANVRARINATDNVNSTAANYNDGKFHRIGIRRNGTSLEVWTDGVPTTFAPDAGGNVDVSAGGSDAFIGVSPEGNGFGVRLQGGIAEVIGVKGTLSGTDATNLDGYFKTKYNLQ